MSSKQNLVLITDNRSSAARAVAVHLLALGYRVVLNHVGGDLVAGSESTVLDLADETALNAWFDACGDDLLAVIHPAPPPIHASVARASESDWRLAFQEGALAALLITKTAGSHLTRLGRGCLIYLGSIHAEKPMGHGFLFSMGCSATQMLCREAALDFGAKGVCAYYVQRGIQSDDLGNANNLTNIYHATELRYPQKQLPGPDHLNGLLAFLLTDGAAPLNGADLQADSGLTLFYGHRREGAGPV